MQTVPMLIYAQVLVESAIESSRNTIVVLICAAVQQRSRSRCQGDRMKQLCIYLRFIEKRLALCIYRIKGCKASYYKR